MKSIIVDAKGTYGDTYFLGYEEKMKFDRATGKRTDEVEAYTCKLSSSRFQEQIEATVPLSVPVDTIKFNQKVTLKGVEIDPYGKTTKDSTFAQVVLRLRATDIIDESNVHLTTKK